MKQTYITTSWDDGHQLDLRVAELLTKYRLHGTFYIPKAAENGTMKVAQVRELSRAFEIGAHTLHHVVLTSTTDQQAWQEIIGSKSWVEESTGLPCLMFCPPTGRYSNRHVEMVRKAGYLGLRTVEMVSLDFPRQKSGLMLLPTTVHAYPHSLLAFARNTVKRAAFGNLWRFVVHGCSTEWPTLARSLLRQAVTSGGVFHLWGHSWALQETGQWQRLDEVLRFMSEFASQVPALTNGQICLKAASFHETAREGETARKGQPIRSER